ncbi:MAG: hypothetical protein ACTSRS_11755 [Candidatus Helarchaeota archaeon]
MRFLFKFLKTDLFYRNRLIRFIPEFIAFFAASSTQPSIYTLQELERIIELIYKRNGGSKDFGILFRPCPCRDAQRQYSQVLPNITDVLFTTNNRTLRPSRDNIFVSKTILLKQLRKFDKIGLVHMVLGCLGEEGYGINICNCHISVCFVLQVIVKRGFQRGLNPGPSICTCDSTKCKGIADCGVCLTRCPFHARTVFQGKGAVRTDHCFGCGLCANSCETGATQMIPRKGYRPTYFPLQFVQRL